MKRVLVSVGVKNLYKIFQLSDHYLKEVGWNHSVNKAASVDKLGEPIPWFTYPCIRFLDSRLNKDLTLFEFGSGNSTLWFSKKLGKVISIEHNKDWYYKLDRFLQDSDNVTYLYKNLSNGEYKETILEYNNEFDIVVIDGRDRVNCCFNSIKALNNEGIIIWDNSDRERYTEGFNFLNDRGFRRIDFWGVGPINHQEWCTTIFYKSNNCLGI